MFKDLKDGQAMRWAAIAGVSVALYYVIRKRRANSDISDSHHVLITDFDSFLVQQGEVPTGLGPTAKGNSKERSGGGPFEEFLKDSDERNPADFSTFLKSSGAKGQNGSAAPVAAQVAPEEEEEEPEPNMAKVVLMYGTEYGFSKEITEKLAAKLKASGSFWPVVLDMAELGNSGFDLSKVQALLVACSTQGDGVPPTEARPFCDWLFTGKAGALGNVQFSVCALGDKSYTHFCRCGKQIDAALEAAGAKRFVDRVDVDKENWKAVNGWMDTVLAALPGLKLKSIQEAGDVITSGKKSDKPKRWGKSRPYPAKVLALEGLCTIASKDDKNTIRVELDMGDSGMTYVPGDALGIYPHNASEGVQDLLAALGGATLGAHLVPLPSFHYDDGTGRAAGTKVPLQEVLTKCYDLRSPKAELLQLIADALPAGVDTTAASLKALLSDEAARTAYFDKRHVADVLRDFPGAKLTPEKVLGALRQLQPRLYSISSSPLEGSTRVQATIAEVKYNCLGKDRIGVCSTFVSERIKEGTEVAAYIHHNPDFRLPSDPSKPILMVGPGTGLAPFRSFIQERLLQAQAGGTPSGQMVLYFGCRRSDQDYLYGEVLEGWAKEGKITLFAAFSRQQAQKVYVQDRLRESAELVWQLLHTQGGHFYVCGDAGSMAGAVEQELLKIIEAKQGGGAKAAQKYLDKLSSEGRYQRDVWY